MMDTIYISCNGPASRSYPLWIGDGILSQCEKLDRIFQYSKICIVYDRNVSSVVKLLLTFLPSSAVSIELDISEERKSYDLAVFLWSEFLRHKLDRDSLVLNVGGGVLGDAGGFAASTYMRGISFLQVPTTLLAQVDASIGGKVGINFQGVKNLVGSFQQPVGVLIDISTLDTLPRREISSGWAEIIKHGVVRDAKFFSEITRSSLATLTKAELIGIIKHSCLVKKEIVEQDEREGGIRKVLNFGHTIGHALESFSHMRGTPLLHGEAIALGMLVEAHISRQVLGFPKNEFDELRLTIEKYELPIESPFPASWYDISDFISTDKKNSGGKIHWTLLSAIGKSQWNCEVSNAVVSESLRVIAKDI